MTRKPSTAPSSPSPANRGAGCNETATQVREAPLVTVDLDTRALAEALADLRATFVAALARADTETLAGQYTQDATLLPPAAAPISGRDAIKRFWQAGIDAGIVAIRLDAASLDHDRRLAYELGGYELRLEPADSRMIVDRGNYLLVHSRQADGSWRRRVEIFTPNAQPA
jgi:ketosteroid isomerase-like protein